MKSYVKPEISRISCEEIEDTMAVLMSGGGHVVLPSMAASLLPHFDFGINPPAAALTLEYFWDRINSAYASNQLLYRNWLFFRALGNLVYGNAFLKDIAWNTVAGPFPGEEILFEILEMDAYSIGLLRRGVLAAGEDTSEIDFPHLCITTATHLSIELGFTLASSLMKSDIDFLTDDELVCACAGWLGDATIASPSEISFPKQDADADMDAVNLASLMINFHYSAKEAIRHYYGSFSGYGYRVYSFKSNTGLNRWRIVQAIIAMLCKQNYADNELLGQGNAAQEQFLRETYPETMESFVSRL